MKTLFLIALTSLVILSCKKADDVSASQNIVGTYTMSSAITYNQNGSTSSQAGSGTLSVVRISDNLFEISEGYSGFSRKYRVSLSGTSLTLSDGQTESVRITNNDFLGTMAGTGIASTDGKSISLNTTTTVTGNSFSFTKKVAVSGVR